MAIDNHSVEAAYASKPNIVVPSYTTDAGIAGLMHLATDDIWAQSGLTPPVHHWEHYSHHAADAIVNITNTDTALQADGNADVATLAASASAVVAVNQAAAAAYTADPDATVLIIYAWIIAAILTNTKDGLIQADNVDASVKALSTFGLTDIYDATRWIITYGGLLYYPDHHPVHIERAAE